MVVDLERQLEDTRSELAQKKKDEKDMRNEDLTQKLQISGVSKSYLTKAIADAHYPTARSRLLNFPETA